MINFHGLRVLVLAPHTDDAELGMGGTIAKMKREGAHVSVVAFSAAEESLPEGFEEGITRKEFSDSMRLYQVDEFRVLDFKVRNFPRDRQSILDELIRLRSQLKPDIIFCPSHQDVHQDHHTIHIEALRAFKTRTILCYELPWNCFQLQADLFLELTESDFNLKCDSINLYKSQLAKQSMYFQPSILRAHVEQNAARLGRIGLYEAFKVMRVIN